MRSDPTLAPDWAALRPDLDRAAQALGIALDANQRDRLLAYGALIQRWTQVYNLTAVRDTRTMFTHHLLDCLAILPALDAQVANRPPQPDAPVRVLDVGSGAGLPGVVIALLRPDWRVTCVDAVLKKISFIRQAAAELDLPNLEAVHGRVEASTPQLARAGYTLITSRAFASLRDFVTLTRDLLTPGGAWAAMKAQPTPEELADLPSDVEMFHVEHLDVPGLDATRRLLFLRPAVAHD